MFSKVRKHFNIVIGLIFVYVISMIVLFVGVNSFYKNSKEKASEVTSASAKEVKAEIGDLISDACNYILLLEKQKIEQPDASMDTFFSRIMEYAKESESVYELKNIVVYNQSGLNNAENPGIDTETLIEDLPWAYGMKDEYVTKVTYYYDENLGEEYLIVSQLIDTEDTIIGMCYDVKDLAEDLFLGEKGDCYFMTSEGNVILSNQSLHVNENAFEKNNVLKENKSMFDTVSNGIREVTAGKGKFYISVEKVMEGMLYVSVAPNEKILESERSWYYTSIIFVILITAVSGLGFAMAYIAKDRMNNLIDSKANLIEEFSKEIRKYTLASSENAKYILMESKNETLEQKANAIGDVNNAIEFILRNASNFAKMHKKGFQNEKGEYTVEEMMKGIESIVSSELKRHNLFLDVQIEVDERLKFYGDRNQVEQAIVNLLMLSIEKSYQGGIEVVVSNDEIFADKTNLVIRTKDSSPGLEQAEVTEMMEKVANKTKKFNVSDIGMGIEMIKLIIQNLKGKFEVQSTKNVGSEFVLKLPQIALFNTDESFLRELQNKKEKQEEEELNNSFWDEVTANNENNNSQNEDDDLITMTDMGATSEPEENEAYAEMSDMGISDEPEENEAYAEISDMGIKNEPEQNETYVEMTDMGVSPVMETNISYAGYNEVNEASIMESNVQYMGLDNNVREEELDPSASYMNEVEIGQEEMVSSISYMEVNDSEQEQVLETNGGYNTEETQVKEIEENTYEENTYEENSYEENVSEDDVNEENDARATIDSVEEMNRKYIEMLSASKVAEPEEIVTNEMTEMQDEAMQETGVAVQNEQNSPYYNTETINSMGINTLYVDDEEHGVEEDEATQQKREKMYIYLREDSIIVDEGLSYFNNNVDEYEMKLKEFYNYSHKNVRNIIALWNQKKFEEYYIEITKITTNTLNIGANKLYDLLCEQQNNYNAGDMRVVANNVKVIFDEWKKVLLYIADYFKN